MPSSDPWLQRWLPLLTERAGSSPVLEIGCGRGDDTLSLATAGLQVIAFDLSAEAVEAARQRVPRARIGCQDVRAPFPDGVAGAGVAIASLTLHYFPWDETLAIAARIHDTLRPGGVLLCRLNSTEDHHYGASGHAPIAPHYYLVDGAPKRFFDRRDVEQLFAHGWRVLSLEHRHTGKYGLPKALWEVVVEKEG